MQPMPLQTASEVAQMDQAFVQMRGELARMETQRALEQARMQGEMARVRAQMARDQAQMARDMARGTHTIYIPRPFPFVGLSRRHEGMLFVGGLTFVIAAAVVLLPLFRALGRRIEGRGRPSDLTDPASAERLQRIEQAVEAMAIEIERISEGQRFTTRLLAERADAELKLGR